MGDVKEFKAKKIWQGKASGPALVTKERFSFGGFVDPKRGVFNSPMTDLKGSSFVGAVLIFTSGDGSSSGPSAFDLACRYGNWPAAIVNLEVDPFIVQGCVFQNIPMVQVEDPSIFEQVKSGDMVTVDADKGEIIVS
jgi:predicted aconitase with swiveling domain